MTQLHANKTSKLVDRPPDRNVVSCWWTYRLKQDATSKIVHYKARLISQGFTQAPRVHFNDTFAPVTKITTNCLILALAGHHDWEVDQMDVKNVYLNAKLAKEIYMEQPPNLPLLEMNTSCVNYSWHSMAWNRPAGYGMPESVRPSPSSGSGSVNPKISYLTKESTTISSSSLCCRWPHHHTKFHRSPRHN